MVQIACSLCKSSCSCYFTHNSTSLCHNPSCAAHTQTPPYDTINFNTGGPKQRDPVIVRFADVIPPNLNSRDYKKFRVFEVPLLCVCGAGADCTLVTRLGYVNEKEDVMQVKIEQRGEESKIKVVAKRVHKI